MFFYILLLFFISLLGYFYIKYRYFTLRGPIPGIPPQFYYGNLLQLNLPENDSIAHGLEKLKKQFGDIYQFWMGSSRYIVLNRIEDVQYVFKNRQIYEQSHLFTKTFDLLYPDSLICSTGETYRRHASIIVPLLRRGKLLPHMNTMIDCTDKLINQWRLNNRNTLYKNLVIQMEQLTMLIFGFFAFGYDLKTLDNNDGLNNEFTCALHDYINMSKMIMFYPRFLMKIYLYFNRSFQKSLKIIRYYLKELNNQTNVITPLISSLKSHLTNDEVLNEILALLAAGYEGSSIALSWLIFCLSKHKRIQIKLKEELKEKNLFKEKYISIEQLDQLKYFDYVISEVMRWSPNFDFTVRTLITDDHLPTTNIQLYQGESVLISFYNLSHDQRYWNINPELFYPERFQNEDQNHHPYASIPFGAGHRACKGQDYSKLELKIILLKFMQELTFIDGGNEINAGGHYQTCGNVQPKSFAIYIHFD